jgi:type II secretion system protein N
MTKFKISLIILICIPAFIILVWLFAVPEDLIREQIDDTLAQSGNNNISLSIDGMSKGILLSLNADSLNMEIDGKPAVAVTGFRCSFTPRYLADGKPGFLINGKIGTGDVNGYVTLPVDGKIHVEKAQLNAIPYLTNLGIDINGSVSSDIIIKGESVTVEFEVPDLDIAESALSVIPFLNTFHKIQGALSVKNNIITFDSVSLEGDKGYARLKGRITNGYMNMALEVMPEAGKLTSLEKMLIGKYIVSPGYYVVPLKGPVM